MQETYPVGIIGGGVSGVVIALQLAELGINCVLFEKKTSVVNGPPFCHLHAGGNLYPDITDKQCRILMKQSIDMARLFPQAIDERPTFISIPRTESYSVATIEKRLKMLVDYYKKLIEQDAENEVLGKPEDYYKLFQEEDLEKLLQQPMVERPKFPDEWMANAVKVVDYKQLKTPLILVQEYGWNLFRLAAQAQLALQKAEKCNLKLNTEVKQIKDVSNQNLGYNWEITTDKATYRVHYLVNATGFMTSEFDKTLNLKTKRLIEYKAAYVSKWQPIGGLIPEMIFHGERGTPHGMAQLTPYFGNHYQIHGMTEDITLFKNGVIKIKENNLQPKFDRDIHQKLSNGWQKEEVKTRTDRAIRYVAKFIPAFETAFVAGPPLSGAQQVPGDNLSLRVGEVSFPAKFYARSEIVKASSALSVAHQIIEKLKEEKVIDSLTKQEIKDTLLRSVSQKDIDVLARQLAKERGYPQDLAHLLIAK